MNNLKKLLLIGLVFFLSIGATAPIVPRNDGEGSLGTAAKHWGTGYFNNLLTTSGPWVDADAYTLLADAVTAASGKTLLIRSVKALPGDQTIGASVSVLVLKGGSFTNCATHTLTINGPFSAGLYQVFDGPVIFSYTSTEAIYPQWFGAKGDASNDDTNPIQWAVTAAVGGCKVLIMPAGYYLVSSEITITNALTIQGAVIQTSGGTTITKTVATQNVFLINGPNQVMIRDLQITSNITSTAGAGIKVTDPSTANGLSRFSNLFIDAQYYGIWFNKSGAWILENSELGGNIAAEVLIENTYNVDQGDNKIINCIFATAVSTPDAILHKSSGGLTIIGNKFLSHTYAYRLSLADAATTGGLYFIGNSVENQTGAGLKFENQTANGTFVRVVIVGNEIDNQPIGIHLAGDRNSFLGVVNITGNNIAPGTDGTGVKVDYGTEGLIASNTLFAAGGGTTTGILIGAYPTSYVVGTNSFLSFTTNINVPAATPIGYAVQGAPSTGKVITWNAGGYADWE